MSAKKMRDECSYFLLMSKPEIIKFVHNWIFGIVCKGQEGGEEIEGAERGSIGQGVGEGG